jgi:hypothetical protein
MCVRLWYGILGLVQTKVRQQFLKCFARLKATIFQPREIVKKNRFLRFGGFCYKPLDRAAGRHMLNKKNYFLWLSL